MSGLATENQYLETRIKGKKTLHKASLKTVQYVLRNPSQNAAALHCEPLNNFGIVTRINKCPHHPTDYQAHLVAHDAKGYILRSSETFYSEGLMEGFNDALLDLLEKVSCEIEDGHIKEF